MLNNLLGVIFVLCYAIILSKIKFESEKKKIFFEYLERKISFFLFKSLASEFL